MARPGHLRNTASPVPNNRGGPVVQPADRLGGVEGHAVGDAAAAVVSGDVEAGEAWSLQEPDAVLRHGPLAVARPLPYRGAARRGPGSAPRLPRPEPVRGRAGRLGLTGVGVAHPNRSVDPCRARGGASSVPSTGCGTSGRSAAAEPEEHAWPASGSGRRTP